MSDRSRDLERERDLETGRLWRDDRESDRFFEDAFFDTFLEREFDPDPKLDLERDFFADALFSIFGVMCDGELGRFLDNDDAFFFDAFFEPECDREREPERDLNSCPCRTRFASIFFEMCDGESARFLERETEGTRDFDLDLDLD